MPKRSSVSPERNRNKRRKSLSNDESCNVFVGNLSFETKWQALKDHMRRAGNVDSVRFELIWLIDLNLIWHGYGMQPDERL